MRADRRRQAAVNSGGSEKARMSPQAGQSGRIAGSRCASNPPQRADSRRGNRPIAVLCALEAVVNFAIIARKTRTGKRSDSAPVDSATTKMFSCWDCRSKWESAGWVLFDNVLNLGGTEGAWRTSASGSHSTTTSLIRTSAVDKTRRPAGRLAPFSPPPPAPGEERAGRKRTTTPRGAP